LWAFAIGYLKLVVVKYINLSEYHKPFTLSFELKLLLRFEVMKQNDSKGSSISKITISLD